MVTDSYILLLLWQVSAKESKSISDVTTQTKTEKESVGSRVKSESGNMVSHGNIQW